MTPEQIMQAKNDVATLLLNTYSDLLFKIHHPSSARALESVLQIMPDDRFAMLYTIVIGNENDDFVQWLILQILARLVVKQELMIEDINVYRIGMQNFIQLMTFEGLRRKGHVLYLWPEDFFAQITDGKFVTLTEEGKQSAAEFRQELLLNSLEKPLFVQ
jgi:hypothetical protein